MFGAGYIPETKKRETVSSISKKRWTSIATFRTPNVTLRMSSAMLGESDITLGVSTAIHGESNVTLRVSSDILGEST
ncbi:MAG: hypothetical protein LBH04_12625 [Tannerellaceae bacterium]|jgi:hypothetical protein|nr:hypothetical protein [Tannerellaceae bacterium]